MNNEYQKNEECKDCQILQESESHILSHINAERSPKTELGSALTTVRTNWNHFKHGGDLENESKQATFMSLKSRSKLLASTFCVNLKI